MVTGLAYALLANVSAAVGIYMAVFPVIPYILLGTSRHNSMGTFAVISLLVGRAVTKFAHHPEYLHSHTTTNGSVVMVEYSEIEVGTCLCLLVGFWHAYIEIVRKLGVGNAVGSCFSCIAFSASLSRSIVAKGVGGRTQLTALVSGLLIVVTLLWIADFFEPLPRARETPGLKLVHYCGALNFATRQRLREEVARLSGVAPQRELRRRLRRMAKKMMQKEKIEVNGMGKSNPAFDGDHTDSTSDTSSSGGEKVK
ncbi:hypothetical protein B566_EDAN006254 [Ephemera danica]|nr:hypothetical protein B566_EDAN006254 [Ephemera danica]